MSAKRPGAIKDEIKNFVKDLYCPLGQIIENVDTLGREFSDRRDTQVGGGVICNPLPRFRSRGCFSDETEALLGSS